MTDEITKMLKHCSKKWLSTVASDKILKMDDEI
jgi:hypothetical protein